MDKNGIREIITFFKEYLRTSGLPDAKVLIFGSFARGNPGPDSDVDIAILSRSFENRDIYERARMVAPLHVAAVGRFRMPFDIVTFTPAEYEDERSPVAGFVREAGAKHEP